MLRVLLVCSIFFGSLRSCLADDTQPLAEEQHSSWSGEDGAPQGIRSLAMAPNGMLWLATMAGVYFFDGRVFSQFDFPDPRVHRKAFRSVQFTRGGDMWLVPLHGSPLRLRGGQLESLDRADDGTIDKIGNLQEAPDGTIWAAMNEQYLVRLGDDGIWHRVPLPNSGPTEHLTQVHVDGRNSVWVVLGDRVYLRSAGQPTFQPTSLFVYGMNAFADGLNGEVWIASAGPATSSAPAHHLQHASAEGAAIPTREIKEELFAAATDANGSVWLLTSNSMLAHLSAGELNRTAPLSIAVANGASELQVATQDEGERSLIRGRDGAFWVGGMGGLERFATATLDPLVPNALPGLWDNCVERDGRQWVKDPHDALLLFEPGRPPRTMPETVEALYCSEAGVLFRNNEGLWIAHGEHVSRLPALPGLAGYSNHYIFTGGVITPAGKVIAAAAGGAIGRSLWTYDGEHWTRLNLPQQLPEITAMYATSDRRAELGLHDGRISWLEDGRIADPVAITPSMNGLNGFAKTRAGLLVFGVRGIALLTGGSAVPLRFARPEMADRTTGAVEADDGSLWLNAAQGVVRIAADEWVAAAKDPRHVIEASNVREGNFVGPSQPSLFSDRAQMDAHGRLWFSTLNGIVSINPKTVVPDMAPQVVLRDVLGDGHTPLANRSFRPDVGVVSIGYTGIDYKDPNGLTYAYKLVGYDKDWQNVGSRTEAVYTHLGSGHYRFLVKARNAFGVWTEPASLDSFTVEPHFYERAWFLLLCLCLAASLIWLSVQLRVRSVASKIRDRAEARADERVSIARDLHDTLLQGIQGLLLTLHAAAEKVPSDHQSKQALEQALISTEKFVIEGRDRVKGLRAFGIPEQDLGEALALVAEDAGCRDILDVSVVRSDGAHKLSDQVASEIFLIGREAVLNASKHADATRISLRLNYASAQFSLECKDNGRGFDHEVATDLDGGSRFGLRGMEERARNIKALLAISSSQGIGTSIELSLRATLAYDS